MTVDVQRNRITTTTVLKQAESLADSGETLKLNFESVLHHSLFCTGKLDEAQAALKGAIQTLETSLSREQDFCKVIL